MSSHFKLCTYASGVAGLVPLDEVLYITQADPLATYQGWTEIVGGDSYGQPVKLGLPVAHWHFEWLAQPDVDALLDLEGHCFIRTEKRTGTIRELGNFDAYLVVTDIGEPIVQEGIPNYPQKRGPIEIDFQSMIAV